MKLEVWSGMNMVFHTLLYVQREEQVEQARVARVVVARESAGQESEPRCSVARGGRWLLTQKEQQQSTAV
jgi:hypothetical protein